MRQLYLDERLRRRRRFEYLGYQFSVDSAGYSIDFNGEFVGNASNSRPLPVWQGETIPRRVQRADADRYIEAMLIVAEDDAVKRGLL